jgi:lipoprotein LprG
MDTRRAAVVLAAGSVAVLAAVATISGCTRDGGADQLAGRSASELLAAAAEEMAEVETVRLRVELEADTGVAGAATVLPVRDVDGHVTAAGDAQGTARVEQFGQLVELEFVVTGDDFHYRLLGTWQRVPRAEAAGLYDPSVILDPDRGLAHLLRTATDADLAGTERIGGVDTVRVTAMVDPDAAAALLPGAPDELTATIWIGTDRTLLHRVVLTAPGFGTATVTLSDHHVPVEIRAP